MATQVTGQRRGGKPDLQKLAESGRIKLTSDGKVVGVPENNVLRVNKKKIIHEGVVLKEIEIPVNGGHAKAEGSVWRAALKGPKKYHEMVLLDREFIERTGKKEHTMAPQLEAEEFAEYKKYLEFLKESDVEIAENADFYSWLNKPKVGRPKKEEE